MIGNFLNLLWQMCVFGQILLVQVNGQIWIKQYGHLVTLSLPPVWNSFLKLFENYEIFIKS